MDCSYFKAAAVQLMHAVLLSQNGFNRHLSLEPFLPSLSVTWLAGQGIYLAKPRRVLLSLPVQGIDVNIRALGEQEEGHLGLAPAGRHMQSCALIIVCRIDIHAVLNQYLQRQLSSAMRITQPLKQSCRQPRWLHNWETRKVALHCCEPWDTTEHVQTCTLFAL